MLHLQFILLQHEMRKTKSCEQNKLHEA
jgi:hypothetical protein